MTTPLAADHAVADEPNPLLSLFRRCVVRLESDAGHLLGTGFFVAPGRILTCGHVVHGATGLVACWQEEAVAPVTVLEAVPPLSSVSSPAEYPLPDVALLNVETAVMAGHPCVLLSAEMPASAPAADRLLLRGYTLGEHAEGEVTFSGVNTEFDVPVTEAEHSFFKLARGQVLAGYSGAPLLNLRSLQVCGMVESSRGTRSDLGGFAVPLSLLDAALAGVLDENARFHASDDRWQRAAEAERVKAAARAGQQGRLPLLPPTVRLVWDEERSPAEAFRPRHAVVPYVGRDELLADIASWSERDSVDGSPVELWVVTGTGGSGKTRLAVQACVEARERGWTAGLLRNDVNEVKLAELADWPGRLFVAIDYAEARPAVVGQLVTELVARAPRAPVRLLVLVRKRLTRPQLALELNPEREEQLAALIARTEPCRLEEGAHEVDRLELFEHAQKAFATLAGLPASSAAPPRLRGEQYARPLFVLVAAYLRARNPTLSVDELSERDLLLRLVDEHEADHWDRWVRRHDLRLDRADQRIAVALATLLTAADEAEALRIVDLMPHSPQDPRQRITIARWLARLYGSGPSDDELTVSPLEPDRLGEVLVADVLRRRPELLEQAAEASTGGQLTRLLTVAGRGARDDPPLREAPWGPS